MIFIHGWPELGVFWRRQLLLFGAAAWRCVAPGMRGYGGSSVPKSMAAYAVRELVADMVEHATLGGEPATEIGPVWGSARCMGGWRRITWAGAEASSTLRSLSRAR